jgi:hypothetical protein
LPVSGELPEQSTWEAPLSTIRDSLAAQHALAKELQTTNLAGGFFDLNYLAALIVAAFGARPMRQLALVAVGTFGQRLRRQMVVGAALGCTRLGMTPFRIWHENLFFNLSGRAGLHGRISTILCGRAGFCRPQA